MSRRRSLVLLAIVGFCVLAAFLFRPHPPRYFGKTMAEWFEEPDVRSRGLGTGTAGLQFFLDMRGEAVPFLTRTARKGPNWASSRYAILHSASPPELQRMLPAGPSDSEYRDRQARALWLLGTMAYWERQPARRWGLTNSPLPISLIQGCVRDCLRDPSWMVRVQAVEAAGHLAHWAEPLIPALTAMLRESNEHLRVAVIKALGDIGPAASNSAPCLQQLLPRTTASHEAQLIVESLSRIGLPAISAAPATVAPGAAGLPH